MYFIGNEKSFDCENEIMWGGHIIYNAYLIISLKVPQITCIMAAIFKQIF